MNSDFESRSCKFQTSTHKRSPSFEHTKTSSQKHLDGSRLEYQTLEIEKVSCVLPAVEVQDIEGTFLIERCSGEA